MFLSGSAKNRYSRLKCKALQVGFTLTFISMSFALVSYMIPIPPVLAGTVGLNTVRRYADDDDRFSLNHFMNTHPDLQKNAEAMELWGLSMLSNKRNQEALRTLSQANALAKGNFNTASSLAYGLCLTGKGDQGMSLIDKVLAGDADNCRALTVKSLLLGLSGKEVGADQCLKHAESVLKDKKKDEYFLVKARIDTALRRFHSAQALELADAYVKGHPGNVRALVLRAETKRFLGKSEAAIKDFDEVLRLRRDHATALKLNGDLNRQAGHYEKAISLYERFRGDGQDTSRKDLSSKATAECYEKLRRYKEALKARNEWLGMRLSANGLTWKSLETVKNLNLQLARELLTRSFNQVELGLYKDALKDLNLILRHYPRMASALERRAICLTRLKRYKEALADYNQLILEQSQYPRWYKERGKVYESLGEKSKARADEARFAELSKLD
ncbi:MAG: tetratricopeptide repeat protein [Candidatus Melainabacteria bacterium]|nr:tetratricopeptide repeat protein [Candidatus Melainabacteria bacterium]